MSRSNKGKRIVTSKVPQPVAATSPQTLKIEQHATTYHGPLPPPAALAEYERTLPGLADRIMVMAEGESLHRRKHESQGLLGEQNERRLGQVLGFVVALAVLTSATTLAINGYELAGGIVGATGIAGAAAVFVQGRKVDGK